MKLKSFTKTALALVLMLAVIGCAFFLPEYFLNNYSESDINQVITPPADTYQINNSALSALASMQLTNYEKMRLISHVWEGNSESIGAEYSDEDAYSMVELAKKNLKEYYRLGLYPSNFTSEDGASWYNWEAERYCSTDATFHRFSAYFWVIKLVKYDQTEDHFVIMMEDGTILCAGCNIHFPQKGTVRIEQKCAKLPIVRGRSYKYTAMKNDDKIPYYDKIPTNIDIEPTSVGKLSINLKNGTEDYYLAQQVGNYYGTLLYGFQIIPAD